MPKNENGSGLLTKEQILSADDLATNYVEVPEWGGRIKIREMSGEERDLFQNQMAEVKSKVVGGEVKLDVTIQAKGVQAYLCWLTIIDEKMQRLFTSQKDVEALGRKSYKALVRVYDASARLSGISADSIEETEKNLQRDPSESPSSASV